MGCLSGIAAAITNDCTSRPTAGTESIMYLMNRADLTATVDESNAVLLKELTLADSKLAYKVTAVNKENNAGFDGVVADNLPNLFTHYISVQPYSRDADTIKALDTMDDVVAVVELKGPKAEGKFIVLGFETGLHLSSASGRANDNNGLPTYEFQTRAGEEELYSRYILWNTDYNTTKEALEALTVEEVESPD